MSGTGNVEPGVDDAVNFATSGTLKTIDVTVGQHVKKGQLIATLDPTSAQLTLSEAQDALTSAKDQLTSIEDGDSTSSSSNRLLRLRCVRRVGGHRCHGCIGQAPLRNHHRNHHHRHRHGHHHHRDDHGHDRHGHNTD